jgi:hypothetical protein
MRILGYGSPFAGLYRLKQHPLKYSTKNKKQLQLSAHINLPNESLKQGENPSSQTKISFCLILQVFVSLTELNQAHLFPNCPCQESHLRQGAFHVHPTMELVVDLYGTPRFRRPFYLWPVSCMISVDTVS